MVSFSSYQLSITESNYDVRVNIDSVPRSSTGNQQIECFPWFPLRNQGDGEGGDLSNEEKEFVKRLYVDEEEINRLEEATRDQANNELWMSEGQYRFTASNFYIYFTQTRKS